MSTNPSWMVAEWMGVAGTPMAVAGGRTGSDKDDSHFEQRRLRYA